MKIDGVTGYIASVSSSFSRLDHEPGRVAVPVRPSQTVFAQYRHVSGVPASVGQRSIPLTRLQILDSLLSNIQRVNLKRSGSLNHSVQNNSGHSAALVERYAANLHRAVSSVPQTFGSLGTTASAGMVFSLTA